ncbi:MAG: porin family protein [Gallionella sp.]
MKKIAIVALLSAIVASPAWADSTGKMYIAGDLGSASFTNANIGFFGGGQATFPNPGMIRVAGGFHFSPMMALEVGYTMFGDSIVTVPGGSFNLQARSLHVAAVGSIPVSPQFDLTGKIGLTNNSYNLKSTGNAVVVAGATSSQSDILFGIGAQLHLSSQMTLRAQYENYGKFDNFAQPLSASTVSIGMVLNFQ